MGLRSASVRRPQNRTIMAPALTEQPTQKTQKLKLAPKNFHKKHAFCSDDDEIDNLTNYNSCEYLDKKALFGSENNMSSDEHEMGLQKMGGSKTSSGSGGRLADDFSTIPQEIPDELMQVVITSMDQASDLATSLLSFEKQLLNDVDNMMNISMDEQVNNDENFEKETRTNELIAEAFKKQLETQRKLDFLRRRVLKLQARLMTQHASGEITGVFEHVHRTLKRLKETSETAASPIPSTDIKPMTYSSSKALVKKLETTKIVQANTLARNKVAKYFGAGSVEPVVGTFRSTSTSSASSGSVVLPPWTPERKQEVQKIAGSLRSELRVVQNELDSEATDSSSGGESCDEFQNYNNQHQQYLSIQKRALWKYSSDRAAIAARWTWLQVQISDLEYRIRQHTELHRQIRNEKQEVTLDGPNPSTLNGYRGQLPGSTETEPGVSSSIKEENESTCARTRPLVGFRKRKLLQTGGLHVISKKAARPSTVRCGCDVPNVHCALCTGRVDPTHPRDPPDVLSVPEKVSLLDPCFHPVFSMSEDVSETIHLEAIMKMPEWQQRSAKMKSLKSYQKNSEKTSSTEPNHHNNHHHRSKNLEHRKKYGRLLKPSTISALSAKIKSKIRGRKAASNRHLNRLNRKRLLRNANVDGFDEEIEAISGANMTSGGASPSSSPLLQMQSISGFGRKNRISSYDIDNIVIPYSVAASTRVEKLQYKEILTPKWRIADECEIATKNNGTIRDSDDENDTEDVTDEAVLIRHEKCELDERKKFLSYLKMPIGYGRARSHKRTDSRAESSDTNTPDPMSPHPVECCTDTTSPIASPTPEDLTATTARRRTISRGGFPKDSNENNTPPPNMDHHQDVQPYELRTFPLFESLYDEMIKGMPEELQQVRTNVHAQDTHSDVELNNSKCNSPGSESTESALVDEDPNDPEWIDVERMSRERHKRC